MSALTARALAMPTATTRFGASSPPLCTSKYKRMDANLIFTVALAAAIVLICKFANETQNKL